MVETPGGVMLARPFANVLLVFVASGAAGLLADSAVKACTMTAAACLEATDSAPLGGRVPLILVNGWNPFGSPAGATPERWQNFVDYFNSRQALRSSFKIYWFGYQSNVVSVVVLGKTLTETIAQLGSFDSTFDRK